LIVILLRNKFVSPNATREVLPALFKGSEVGNAWQSRALALKAIASLADHAPEQLGASLPDVRLLILHYFLLVFMALL
jgi:hypothetical protein